MNKKRFLFVALMTVVLSVFSIQVLAEPLDLRLEYTKPKEGQHGESRGPVSIPEVDLDDYTLLFITPCDGCVLRLLNEDGEVAYTTVINSTSLVLPSNLSGEYRIEIISGNFCFWGYIEL